MVNEYLHIVAKKALRGDMYSARELLEFLWKYSYIPSIRYISYAYVYQIAMNSLIDVSQECARCGGICCRSGSIIPLYQFDINELVENLGGDVVKHLYRYGDGYYLPRPCPFQSGWRCRIHSFKPYACLSYPFATEDEQLEYIKEFSEYSRSVPDIGVPQHCIAGIKIKNIVDTVLRELMEELKRPPTPRELLDKLLQLYRSST